MRPLASNTAQAVAFHIPIRLKLGLNSREHWSARARRVKRERAATRLCARGVRFPDPRVTPLLVTITRISPGTRKVDSDNLPGCGKAVRDEVAALMLMDDGDDRIEWRYAQERGPWGVRVSIATRADP